MKTLIVYASHHHGSTRKLVDAIAEGNTVDLLDAESGKQADLNTYDCIGFASGIDFGRFYPPVIEIAGNLPAGKRVFALFTCAKDNGRYGEEIAMTAQERQCTYLGKYGCRGFNTYGPWKLIGGMNKNHPSREELAAARKFYERLIAE